VTRTLLLTLCLTLCLTLVPAVAGAGGLGRPNTFGPLGLGIGGAGFAGVPNPSTLHYNPAGLTLMRETVFNANLELVTAPRSYEPLDGTATEASLPAIIPAPSVGISTRFAGKGGKHPQPVALGLAFYNTFGGSMEFDEDVVDEGIITSSILLLELVPTVALELTSRLSIGVGLRIGIGSFHIVNNEREGVRLAPSDISGSGTKVGLSVGATFQPHEYLRVGVVWASPMAVEMTGDGETEINPGLPKPDNVSLRMPWPQWAGLGVALCLGPVNLYAGAKWIDWSSFHELVIDLSVINDVVEPLDFSDGFSGHLGLDWALNDRFSARIGLAFDSNTIPDKTVERQYLDAPKVTAALGGSVRVWRTLVLDVAYELLAGPVREVPRLVTTETDASGATVERVTNKPGRYASTIHSIALGARYAY
jgi:long-chain fatty acid transport protein